MVGEEGRPGKKLKKAVKVKKAERPPANPVVDVSILKLCTNNKNSFISKHSLANCKSDLAIYSFCNRLMVYFMIKLCIAIKRISLAE